jgi:hypothetical protein
MKNVKSMLLGLGLMASGAIFGQTTVTTEGKGAYVYNTDEFIIAEDIHSTTDPHSGAELVSFSNVRGTTHGNIATPGTEDYVVFGAYQGAYSDGTIVCKGGGLCLSVYPMQIFIYNDPN